MIARRSPSLGLLLALLALVMQFGIGIPLPRSDVDAVLQAASLCHSNDGNRAPTTPHRPDCALCPICMTVAGMHVAVPASGPAVPTPRVAVVPRSDTPRRAAGPPSPTRLAALPRAPPFQA